MESQKSLVKPLFELDVLRTFVTGIDLGGFGRAGTRLGRSAPAISLQMRKLEEQLGQPLLRRQGRGLVPTEAGELLLGYARRMLQLNDEAHAALRDAGAIEGRIGLGLPEDLAETWLPAVLSEFTRPHPRMRLEARVDSGANLVAALETGALDLAVTWGAPTSGNAAASSQQVLARREIAWIGPPGWMREMDSPVPLVLFDAPCGFRQRATEALDRAGIAWWPAFTSRSLSGLYAAVRAGLGITARCTDAMPAHLTALGQDLPALGAIDLVLHQAGGSPSVAAGALKSLIIDRLQRKA